MKNNAPRGALPGIPAKTALFAISLAMRLLYMTLRVKSCDCSKSALRGGGRTVLLIWHNRISITPYIKMKYRFSKPIYGLVSASRDGGLLAQFFRFFGIPSERGSSSESGARAAIGLIRRLREGSDICITPDGPRGPRYRAKDGAFSICDKAGAKMVFMRAEYKSFWSLKSWDGFMIPKPFSRVELRAEAIPSFAEFSRLAENRGISRAEYAFELLGGEA